MTSVTSSDLWTLKIRTAAGAIQIKLGKTASCAELKAKIARVAALDVTDLIGVT